MSGAASAARLDNALRQGVPGKLPDAAYFIAAACHAGAGAAFRPVSTAAGKTLRSWASAHWE